MSDNYVYANKTAAIVFFSLPTLFVVSWITSLFFGDALKIWIVDNYESYHLAYLITSILVILEIWFFAFAVYLILLGAKGYIANRIPPQRFLTPVKIKIVYGKEAKWNAIAMIAFGIVLLGFLGLMIYGDTITYGGDL